MLRPEQLTRVLIELIFVLLGGLVVWLGLTNQILPDPTKPTGMILPVPRTQASVGDSRRRADCLGRVCLCAPGACVAARRALDARCLVDPAGDSHARDCSRSVCDDRKTACCCR